MANAPNDWDPRSEALLADQIAGYDAMRQRCLGLGFIVSMMMVHAPVILSAVARVKLQFGVFLYVPLALLHLSLVMRLGFGLFDPLQRMAGAGLNAAAIALFAATVAGAALAWRRKPCAAVVERPQAAAMRRSLPAGPRDASGGCAQPRDTQP